MISGIDCTPHWSLPLHYPIKHLSSKQTRQMKTSPEVCFQWKLLWCDKNIWAEISLGREYQIMRVLNISLAWWNMHCSPEKRKNAMIWMHNAWESPLAKMTLHCWIIAISLSQQNNEILLLWWNSLGTFRHLHFVFQAWIVCAKHTAAC